MKTKRVAVCIASYNRADFLPELFESIQAQTFDDYHVYIGYDGSTDDSLKVIESYQSVLPITILDYEETARIGLNKHRVVELALKDDPDLIQMLDSDDVIKTTFLERSVETIGEYDWLLSWGRCFGERSGLIQGRITPLEEMKYKNTLHSWGMFKSYVLREHNYRMDLDFAEDWNLWLRLTQAGYKGVILEEPLYLQRWHETNLNIAHKYNYAEMRGRVLKGLNLVPIKRSYRFHLLGLVHLPVSERYMSCAFTQKIVKLSKMLLNLGHEVYLYGAETSDAPCTEFIQTHTMHDVAREWGDGDNRYDLGYDWKSEGFRHDFNKPRTRTTAKYYESAVAAINSRKKDDDFLLVMQGGYQRPIADRVGLALTLEPGIGYRGSYARWRAFESAYLQNFTYGSEHPKESINGHYYDRVIPNYFDEADFIFSEEKDDYFLYIGRMIHRKGIETALLATQAAGKKLILAGQGEYNISRYEHAEFIGYVEPDERSKLMAHATAVFVPTIYLEAFGGVNVEAQLCGTPVITTNFGVFPETVRQGETGFLCNTLQDFVEATKLANLLDPVTIREHAERYLMKNVMWEYNVWFDDLYQWYLSATVKGTKGWSYIK